MNKQKTFTRKQAEIICKDYVCSNCWDELEAISLPDSDRVKIICRNRITHKCNGHGFISAKTAENRILKNIVQYQSVSRTYSEWNKGRHA